MPLVGISCAEPGARPACPIRNRARCGLQQVLRRAALPESLQWCPSSANARYGVDTCASFAQGGTEEIETHRLPRREATAPLGASHSEAQDRIPAAMLFDVQKRFHLGR